VTSDQKLEGCNIYTLTLGTQKTQLGSAPVSVLWKFCETTKIDMQTSGWFWGKMQPVATDKVACADF
jgi:hypothetical protein